MFAPSDGLSGQNVHTLFEDREGNIWVATETGLDRFRDFAVATFTVSQGLSNNDLQSVLADRDGTVWLATSGGLDRRDNRQVAISYSGRAKPAKLNGLNPHSLFQDHSGRIWVSTLIGVGYLENDRFVSVRGIPGDANVLSIVEDTALNLWIADEPHGLFLSLSGNEFQHIPWAGLGHKDHASVLAADPVQGGLWLGFFLGGIAYFS